MSNDQQEVTAQEIFDEVATHLAKQKVQSAKRNEARGDHSCLYRGPNSTKCAFGIFIPDELYSEALETTTVSTLMACARNKRKNSVNYGYSAPLRNAMTTELIAVLEPLDVHEDLLRQLQKIHDAETGPAFWGLQLAELAKDEGLEFDRADFEQKLAASAIDPDGCTCGAPDETPHAEDCTITIRVRAAFAVLGKRAEGAAR